MPELPEVETIRRGLEPHMLGRRIAGAEARRPDLRWPLPADMGRRLSGARVETLSRRSKYILIDLSTGETLLIHLGMSGRILISGEQTAGFHFERPVPGKHDHVVIDIEGGPRITFNDARRFGAMDLMPTAAVADHRLLRDLGPEPFGNAFHADYLATRLHARRTPVKSALLDQRVVAGLGNIYVSEALHRTGIRPDRLAGHLSPDDITALVPTIRETLLDAIGAGGSTLRDYRQADGEIGGFQDRFRVYDRQGHACPTPGCGGMIERIVQSGRSSFFCPACQR